MAGMAEPKLVFMFPGQNAQEQRMGKDIFSKYQKARQIWSLASEIYGENLADICFKKPFREMLRTDHGQILIGTLSITLLELLRDEGIYPDIVIGHSSGEMAALYASGVVGLEDVFRLITCRGKSMYEAANQFKGKMVAVKDVGLESVLPVIEKYQKTGTISLGAYNAPTQFVVTGDYDTVSAFEQEMSRNPSANLVDMKQQGAWHSIHMTEAMHKFADAMAKIRFKKPHIPMIFNYSAEFIEDIEEIRFQLIHILTTTVKWYPCLSKLSEYGHSKFVEIGPNKILRGLLRRCYYSQGMNSYEVSNVNDINTLDRFLRKIKEEIPSHPDQIRRADA